MALTVDQIVDKQFREVDGNYDGEEVNEYLDEMCDTLDELNGRIASLESQLSEAQSQLAEAQSRAEKAEAEAQNAKASGYSMPVEDPGDAISLLSEAQQVANSLKETAKKRAAEIVAGAQTRADSLLENAKADKEKLSVDISTLQEKNSSLRTEMRGLIQKYLDMLEEKQ